MAHGLSLELAKIKAPEWRAVDPAKLAANRSAKKNRLSKKFRNRTWKQVRNRQNKSRTEFLKILREHLNVTV